MKTSDRFQLVQELFLAALNMPEAERHAFLHDHRHKDETLRQEVESLLAEHARGSGFLYSGARAPGSGESPLVLTAGTRIGPYEISDLIGTGGWVRCTVRWIRSCAAKSP